MGATEGAAAPRPADAGRAGWRPATTLVVELLLYRHAPHHLLERGVGHVAADTLHGRSERFHDLIQLPGVAGGSHELELHAQPLIAELSRGALPNRRERHLFGHHGGGRYHYRTAVAPPDSGQIPVTLSGSR